MSTVGSLWPSSWDTTRRSTALRYLQVSDLKVRILSRGRDGFIGVGLSALDVKLDRLPGWEPRSYGYHGDDGNIFNGRGYGQKYGPTFTTGDTVGVLYDRIERTISFSKNGNLLGVAFRDVPEEMLYPTVGFRTPDEEVLANFGEVPFVADVTLLRRELLARVQANIRETPLESSDAAGQSLIGKLIFEYCTHHGYWDTAALVARDALCGAAGVSEAQRAEQAGLQRISELIRRGALDEALALCEQLQPGIFALRPDIHFRLLAQKLAGMIGSGNLLEAVEFGQTTVSPAAKTAEDQQLLEDVGALIAYAELPKSPSARLLSPEHRAELATSVVRAFLQQAGKRELSALEIIHSQACICHSQLREFGDPCVSAVPDVDAFVRARGAPTTKIGQESDDDTDMISAPEERL
ncbi:hypothetical protein QBZ16_000305 [Prototheca wickerhamii]|uniref:Uncharacterized protein n=1 Tax=Prototheca wickerhamii TaxID=3111 RepID=A0AAD9IPB3_PROWI|nr:hypothetical protein QBZ16_000305 [Prototheca wickerhamii]